MTDPTPQQQQPATGGVLHAYGSNCYDERRHEQTAFPKSVTCKVCQAEIMAAWGFAAPAPASELVEVHPQLLKVAKHLNEAERLAKSHAKHVFSWSQVSQATWLLNRYLSRASAPAASGAGCGPVGTPVSQHPCTIDKPQPASASGVQDNMCRHPSDCKEYGICMGRNPACDNVDEVTSAAPPAASSLPPVLCKHGVNLRHACELCGRAAPPAAREAAPDVEAMVKDAALNLMSYLIRNDTRNHWSDSFFMQRAAKDAFVSVRSAWEADLQNLHMAKQLHTDAADSRDNAIRELAQVRSQLSSVLTTKSDALAERDAAVKALGEIRTELEDRYDGAPDSTTLWMGRFIKAVAK